MKFDNNIPIYLQIEKDLKKKLVLGKLKNGEKLPSTRELAVIYSVNPNTTSRVYKELEYQQITYTKRGLGTFVTESKEMLAIIKKEMANDVIQKFVNEMIELGFSYDEMIKIIKGFKSETTVNNKIK